MPSKSCQNKKLSEEGQCPSCSLASHLTRVHLAFLLCSQRGMHLHSAFLPCPVLSRMSREEMSSQTHCPEGSSSQKSLGTSLRAGASKSHCLPWSCEILGEACLCPSKPPPLPLIHPCIPPFPYPCFDYLATVASVKQLL